MHDESRALDVTEELVAKALALARAFDEARDICRDERADVAGAHYAEVGDEGRERVVGNLGARGAHARDERALAHARHAHEGGVGHELHLELDPVLEGGLALLGKGGRPAHGGHKVDVASAARAAGAHDDALPRSREVGDLVEGLHGVGVEFAHHGAAGNLEDEVLAVAAMPARALTMRATLGAEMMLEAIVDERGELRVALEDDVATAAAVTAVGPTLGHEGLAPERHAARPAVATLDVDARHVGELRHVVLLIHEVLRQRASLLPTYKKRPSAS